MTEDTTIEQESREEIQLADTKFLEMPAKFGNIPVPKLPLGALSTPDPYEKLFPHIRLPIQEVETYSYGHDNLPFNQLFWGDNLHIMRQLPKEIIDVIYIDPPFFSGRNYNVIFGDNNEIRSFTDIWEGGIEGYLVWLNARLTQMKRLLKQTGSIYVHLDWHAAHYVKVEMDKIFGYENFQNEIVWKRTTGHSDSGSMGNAHDSILFYTKTKKSTWNKQYQEYDQEYIESHYNKEDAKGRKFRTDNLTAMGLSGGGYEYTWNGVKKVWRCPIETMQRLHDEGRIRYTKNGTAEYIRYLDEMPGKPLQDIWEDISPVNSMSKERIGYPTQKPEQLLERIISASSNPGDTVADFFCGGGTTPTIANKLGRNWIACDQSRVAVAVTRDRLLNTPSDRSDTSVQNKLGEVPGFKVYHWGNYFVPQLERLSESNFREFIIKCFDGEYVATGKSIHGYHKGDRFPIFVGSKSVNTLVNKADVISFAKAILENTHMHEGFLLGWGFDAESKAIAHELRKREGIRLDFVKLEMIKIGTEQYRDWIVKRNRDYDSFLQFILPPVVKVRVKQISAKEFEFDAGDSQSMNSGEKVVNVQWNFGYDGKRFRSTPGYSYSRENDKPILTAKYTFAFNPSGKQVACRIQDSAGGEGFEVLTIE